MHPRLWALPGPHRPATGTWDQEFSAVGAGGAGTAAFMLPPVRGWVLVHYRNVEFRN